MQTGIYLNSLICFIIFVFASWTSFDIYRKEKGSWSDMSIAGFWLSVGITWLLVSLSLVIFKNGFKEIDLVINQYLIQTAIFAQITIGSYYAVYRITKNRKLSSSIFLVFVVSAIVGLYYDYRPGSLALMSSSYCSVEYKISPVAWQIFQAMFAVAMLCVFFDMIKNLFRWTKRSDLFEPRYFLVDLAILSYGLVGFFDQYGVSADWITVTMRSLIVFCVGIVFIAYNQKEI